MADDSSARAVEDGRSVVDDTQAIRFQRCGVRHVVNGREVRCVRPVHDRRYRPGCIVAMGHNVFRVCW